MHHVLKCYSHCQYSMDLSLPVHLHVFPECCQTIQRLESWVCYRAAENRVFIKTILTVSRNIIEISVAILVCEFFFLYNKGEKQTELPCCSSPVSSLQLSQFPVREMTCRNYYCSGNTILAYTILKFTNYILFSIGCLSMSKLVKNT